MLVDRRLKFSLTTFLLNIKMQATSKKLQWYYTIISMNVKLIYNFVEDVLSYLKELMISQLLIQAETELDEVERNFLKNVQKIIKSNKNVILNNYLCDSRNRKTASPEGWRTKNLKRCNGLHYFKQMRLYITEGLKKGYFISFTIHISRGIKEFTLQCMNSKRSIFGHTWVPMWSNI